MCEASPRATGGLTVADGVEASRPFFSVIGKKSKIFLHNRIFDLLALLLYTKYIHCSTTRFQRASGSCA